jgi:hypothetical protein
MRTSARFTERLVWSMIYNSVQRFSEKIMRKQKITRDGDSKKRRRALEAGRLIY